MTDQSATQREPKKAGYAGWRRWFDVGDILSTELKPSPFEIIDISPVGIKVQAPPKTGRRVLLTYDRLDAIHQADPRLLDSIDNKSKPLVRTINKLWAKLKLEPDYKNESQYWALSCHRRRRQEAPVKSKRPKNQPVVDIDFRAIEGEPRLVAHLRRERDPKIADLKRKAVRDSTGRLICEACGCEPQALYPEVAGDLAEVHHRTPLAEAVASVETKLEDLAVLCPNCHRAIHRTRPVMSVEDFRRMFEGARDGS